MALVYITRRAHFSAAHRLHNPLFSDEWNRKAFGACNNPNWHGHNYQLEVTLRGEPHPDTGYVFDLGALRDLIEERVLRHVDHRNLNLDVEFLNGVIPSTENLLVAFWNQLSPYLPEGMLYRLRLSETERNLAEYFGPNGVVV